MHFSMRCVVNSEKPASKAVSTVACGKAMLENENSAATITKATIMNEGKTLLQAALLRVGFADARSDCVFCAKGFADCHKADRN